MIADAVRQALRDWSTVGGIVKATRLSIADVRRSIGWYGRQKLLEVKETALGPMWRLRRRIGARR